MTKVFVAPSKNKNPFLSVFAMLFPIIAAWPLPSPGRKLQIGEAIKAPKTGLKGFIFIFLLIFCFGIFVLVFMLVKSIEDPKSPVKRGSKGSLRSMFKTKNPKNHVIIKTKREDNLFLERSIKSIETKIKIHGIKFSIN